MLNFKEYLQEEVGKTTDEMARTAPIRDTGSTDIYEELAKANPSVWTARIVGGRKYAIYSGKYLDLTALVSEIGTLYGSRGYSGYGFAKLDEAELVRYTKSKNVLMRCFSACTSDELDPAETAESLFAAEPKDFDWKPEEY